MKKLILISAVILMAGITYGQSLQKGNLVGTHVITVSLKQGVTIEQYMEFFKTKVIPQMEKNMPNWKGYLVKGIRGENSNSFGMIIVIKSAQDRDKYYNADGTDSELGKSANEKLKSTFEELDKLGTYTSKYTDWIVQ
jgi:hypothetical protein